MAHADMVAVQVVVAHTHGPKVVTVPSRHVGPGTRSEGHTRHVGPPLRGHGPGGQRGRVVRHVGPGEGPSSLDGARHVGPGEHPSKGTPVAAAKKTPKGATPESTRRERQLKGLEKARAVKKAKQEARAREAAGVVDPPAKATPAAKSTKQAAKKKPPKAAAAPKKAKKAVPKTPKVVAAPKSAPKSSKKTAAASKAEAAPKSGSAKKTAPKKAAVPKTDAAPKSRSAKKAAPKKAPKAAAAPKAATRAKRPETAGPATQRVPGSQPPSPMSDRQILSRLEQNLKEQGMEASFPTFKRIWESGGKAATLAWMKAHKHADVIVAFHDWMKQNIEQAKAMIQAGAPAGEAA